MINLNNTSPAAINGGANVKFQSDSSGNVSAYAQITKLLASPASGVVTLNASLATSFFIPVTQAITSMSVINPTDGQEITVVWQQDITGHAVTVATTFRGTPSVSTTAGSTTSAKLTYNAADTIWFCLGGVSGM